MAFEPNKPIIDTLQTLNRDVRVGLGTFRRGTTVLVTGCEDRGYSIKDPISGAVAIEIGFDCFEMIGD